MEWDKKHTQKEPRITSLSAWTRLHIAYQEEYGNRFVPTSKVRCLPAFIDYIFQQPRIYIGNNSPYLSRFVEKHRYIAMIPTDETGPSRPESIQTAYTGPAEVSKKTTEIKLMPRNDTFFNKLHHRTRSNDAITTNSSNAERKKS